MGNQIQKSLRALDLNLLPILRELLYNKNVSRAAECLHMTQPAVSEALGRLRHQYGDEILVRVGRNMVLTPFAKNLIEPLDEILGSIEKISSPASDRGMNDVERQFVIATADNVMLALGRNMLELLSKECPNVHVQFLDLQHFDTQLLKSGEVDMVIMPDAFLEDDSLNRLFLYQEDFVCISRKNHPGISDPAKQEELSKLSKVGYRADQRSPIRVAGPPGWDEQILLPGMSMIPYIIEKSDSVALTQRHVAKQFAEYMDIDIHEVHDFSWSLDIYVFWGNIYDKSSAHTWMRNRLKDMLTSSIIAGAAL